MGLEKAGSSTYRQTVNSGLANIGAAGTGGRGQLLGATLEMSNVDLAQEFNNLIIHQRGLQSTTRVISDSSHIQPHLAQLNNNTAPPTHTPETHEHIKTRYGR